ncbi:tRNA (adenosine(37)-N6)-dimethylallyltransferase MiaA [Cyanobacterium sp. uoEpiScrs1]|uniref:tRNA (adenosine(37)-N6)-dimethylallyltransferase MiaA n=1 Tax=Cyanobacterium sp. uoEpiScrs1 TaxID=2976343 RepID=UPI00226A3662|nr:tRNA (adenosine(37)-N6)-dimethylallyltransferase MiaA [Cyanobacterium sp. uoEpiScrs1]
MQTHLIVICGATATGKSWLACQLAQRLNSFIISADSRQVYQEFDIGTAKPTLGQQALVPHYLIDICKPTQTLTLAQYQEKAQSLIESAPPLSPPFLVGGTGLYIKSIIRGLKIPRVAFQPQLRLQLSALGQSQCYAKLKQVDPIAANRIHPNDQVRTLRALEVFYVTGCPISEQQGENPPSYPIVQIGLYCEQKYLQERIRKRIEDMVNMGLIEEVEKIIQKYGWNLPLLNTLGYLEIKQYLQGNLSLAEAKKAIITHTRQFAKHQKTWFRTHKEIEWFDITSPNFLEKVWSKLTSC